MSKKLILKKSVSCGPCGFRVRVHDWGSKAWWQEQLRVSRRQRQTQALKMAWVFEASKPTPVSHLLQ